MVAVAFEATAVVVTANVAVVAPAATVTEAGTVADAELLVRATLSPPVGAAELNVTVPVEEFPPTTEVGLKASEDTVGAVIVSVAVALVLFAVAVIVAVVFVATAVVVTVNVAVVAPAATVTEAGTVADVELLVSETLSPPVGAAELIVTVPAEDDPPATEAGLRLSEDTVGAVIVSVAVFEAEL